MNQVHDELREHVFSLPIVDTHEHLPAHEADRPMGNDVLAEYLGHYFSCDLVSAGLTPEGLETARDATGPLAKRWKLIEPFWQAARNTGYGRSLDIAARDLYGFDRIDGQTIGPLNEAFCAARQRGQTYRDVLSRRSNIRVSVLDALANPDDGCDRQFFRPALRLDDFVMAANQGALRALARRAGVEAIHNLGDLEDACERFLDRGIQVGIACLKSGLAYLRPLRYDRPTRAAAEEEFNELFSDRNYMCMEQNWFGVTRKLQDYMMHHVCRLADRRGLTFQIHTGLLEGNGNYVQHSDPALLTNLFLAYPNVRFDLFHIGYPYQQTVAALAKNFRNVFIDFAWAHIISPTAAVNALVEYLDAVPANKISGFGGDYIFVDGVYGHQVIARENIARALTVKVEQGVFDLDRAKEVARMLLHDNPLAIFHLGDVVKAKRPAKKRNA